MTTLLAISAATNANIQETRTYTQPPVITGEFIVNEPDQKHLANLPKDTDLIQVESDLFGIKRFKRDTFDASKIKERLNLGWKKLREDESTVLEKHHKH